MCSVFKIVFINSILLFLVFAQDADLMKMYRPKCNTNLLIDITNGTRNSTSNEIIYNNITYTTNDYHMNISNPFQVLGCLCNIEKCVRKCCAIGSVYNRENNTCVKSDQRTYLQIPVYDKTDEIQVRPNHFKYIFGKNCTYGAYELDPDNYSEDEYYLQQNGSLYFPNSGTIFYKNVEDYCLDVKNAGNSTIIALACFPPPPPEPGIVYSIGMIISMPFLMVTFFVYACVPELQNIHGKCLMSYVSTLFTAYIFLVSVQLNNNTQDVFCVVAPFIIYFAFMVSFMWLNVMCIDIWWTFSGRRGFRSGSNSERTRFLVYSIYAWGIPIIMLSVAIALQFADNLPSYVVAPNFGYQKCWFPDDKSMGYYFYGPILVIILANLTLFAYTSIQIYRVQRDTDQSMRHESQRHGSDNEMKQRYKLYLKLMLVFGVNWLMEIVSWLVSGPQWLWYVTDMCNALYGVFIFFIFVCKANVWKLCRKRYHVFMGRPYLATTYAPTSSTRSTAVSQTTAHAPGNGVEADSYALTSSTAA